MVLRNPIKAVLTGDIVNSTSMSAAQEKKLLKEIGEQMTDLDISFYRGDSFQVFMDNPGDALRKALLSRSLAISMMDDNSVPVDVRISIGLGPVKLPVKLPDNA